MAIYRCEIKIGKRSEGFSAVASASYNASEKHYSEYEQQTFNYTQKKGVVHSEILLPDNAPNEYKDRGTLWNSAEQIEKQGNAQLYREFEIALPNECTREQQIEMTRRFSQTLQKEGMCVDFAIHENLKGDKRKHGKIVEHDNIHAHVMCTMRAIDENGQWLPKAKKVWIQDNESPCKGKRVPVLDNKKVKEWEKKNGKPFNYKNSTPEEIKGLQRKEKNGKRIWKSEKVNTTDWDNPANATKWRKTWANIINEYLPEHEKVSEKTIEAQIEEMEQELQNINKMLSKQQNVAQAPLVKNQPEPQAQLVQAQLVENQQQKQAQLVENQQNVKTQQNVKSAPLSHGVIAEQTQKPQKAPETILKENTDRNTPEDRKAVRELFWGSEKSKNLKKNTKNAIMRKFFFEVDEPEAKTKTKERGKGHVRTR